MPEAFYTVSLLVVNPPTRSSAHASKHVVVFGSIIHQGWGVVLGGGQLNEASTARSVRKLGPSEPSGNLAPLGILKILHLLG